MGMLLRRYHDVSNPTVEETTKGKVVVKNARKNSKSDSEDNE